MDTLRSSISALLPSFDTIASPRGLLQLPLLLNPFSSSTHQPSSIHTTTVQHSCPHNSPSCPSVLPSPIDACCLNHPSGHFLLAQFWDTQPSLGPNNSWTLHGLWPDLCTGGFDAFCDLKRNMPAHTIASIVDEAAKSTHPRLRSYMDEFWKGLHGDDDLWMHEWNKHGTCVSTLEPSCYSSIDTADTTTTTTTSSSSSPNHHLDLLDYLTAATTLHSTLKTHDVLASHGIVPSHTQRYTLDEIQSALESAHGFIGTVKCNQHHELNEVWMHFTVMGTLRNSTDNPEFSRNSFIPTAPDGLKSNCPARGIRYLPKREPGSGPGPGPGPRPTHTSHLPGPTGRPFEGRGFLKVHILSAGDDDDDDDNDFAAGTREHNTQINNGAEEGCLIRQGYWYTSGTCATYRAKADVDPNDPDEPDLFTLASSYAPCAVLEADGKQGKKGEFVCASHLPVQSIFGSAPGSDEDDKVMSWKGSRVFYAESKPQRFEKVKIYGDDGDGKRSVKLELHWVSR